MYFQIKRGVHREIDIRIRMAIAAPVAAGSLNFRWALKALKMGTATAMGSAKAKRHHRPS
jgi:hypothetical protein